MKVLVEMSEISPGNFDIRTEDGEYVGMITTPTDFKPKEFAPSEPKNTKVENAVRLKKKGFDDDTILEILKDS